MVGYSGDTPLSNRLFGAQALIEPMRLLTHDGNVARYGDTIVLV